MRLEEGDVSEDAAAASIAQAVAGEGIHVDRAFTGRANLFAATCRRAGDRPRRGRPHQRCRRGHHLRNAAAFKPVVEGEMVATVKLIPFGVEARPARRGAWRPPPAAHCGSRPIGSSGSGWSRPILPGAAPKVIEKTLRVTAERLAPAGASIIAERRVPHDEAALSAAIKELLGAGAELVIVFGASAIADRRRRRFRRRSPASAARSSISACRSIPATCC